MNRVWHRQCGHFQPIHSSLILEPDASQKSFVTDDDWSSPMPAKVDTGPFRRRKQSGRRPEIYVCETWSRFPETIANLTKRLSGKPAEDDRTTQPGREVRKSGLAEGCPQKGSAPDGFIPRIWVHRLRARATGWLSAVCSEAGQPTDELPVSHLLPPFSRGRKTELKSHAAIPPRHSKSARQFPVPARKLENMPRWNWPHPPFQRITAEESAVKPRNTLTTRWRR